MTFDIVIIGGGAAGQMAAISARRKNPQSKILLVDRSFALGRKILVCGAGRCNITNINLESEISKRYYGANEEFISAVFDNFGYQDIVNFFEELGVELYVERKTDIGKMFPVTNQAKTITEMLLDEMERLEIEIRLNTECKSIDHTEHGFLLKLSEIDAKTENITNSYEMMSAKVILAAGGKTYPALGSNGSGYALAESFGHSVVQPVPAAVPVTASSKFIHLLQGTKLMAEVTSIIDGERVKSSVDEVMFTQYGLSGPAVLNISREISIHFNREGKNNAEIEISFFPGQTVAQVAKMFQDRWSRRPSQTLEKSLYGLFPNKLASTLMQVLDLDGGKQVSRLSAEDQKEFFQNLTAYRLRLSGTRGWNEAEFTAGGLDTREVEVGTLQSKKRPGLYFCGEVLDVDGDVGGFNLSWAWSSGWVVGRSV